MRRRTGRLGRAARGALLLAVSALAGAGAPSAAAAQPLSVYIEEDPSTLDTLLDTPYGWQLGPLTQGYLFLVDDRGRLVPDRALAVPTRSNGGISADGRTIVYRIRTGRWSDGAAFDARDVAFTVNALRNARTNVPDRSTVDRIVSATAVRPDTLRVRLTAAWAPFVSSFLTLGASDPFAIVPQHVVGRLGDLNRSPLDLHPVGLGPFRLARWRRGDRLEFERNPWYWRGPAGAKRVVALVEPDPATRLLQARTGALDVDYISGLDVDAAVRASLRVVRTTTNIVDYLQFNLERPELRDPAVRRAIAEAVDRIALARNVYRGLEEPTDAGQLDPALVPRERLPRVSLAAARTVLAPRHLTLELAIAGRWRSSSAAAVAIAGALERVGVRVAIHSYDAGTFWGPKESGGVVDGGRFDLALTSWSPSLDPDRSYLLGCAARPPNGGNAGHFCDAAFDRLEAAAAATFDERARAALYRRAHARLVRELPILPLGFERSAYAVSARVRNFRPNELGRDYWNAWEWRVTSP